MTDPSAPSRRDLNKAATREALNVAAIDLVRERGFDAVTADAVAERAGVSRRTFFNYFPSLEDCIASPIVTTLHLAITAFEARPADEPIMLSATHAFSEVFNPQATPRLVQVMKLVRSDPRMVRSHMGDWSSASVEVSEALQRRFPQANRLWVQSLAGSVTGVAESAIGVWLAGLPDDLAQGPDALAASETLRTTVAQCFSYLADGFASPPPTS